MTSSAGTNDFTWMWHLSGRLRYNKQAECVIYRIGPTKAGSRLNGVSLSPADTWERLQIDASLISW